MDLVHLFLPSTKKWITNKIAEFKKVESNFGTTDNEYARREINLIKELIVSEISGFSDRECVKLLFYIHDQQRENVYEN